MEEPEADYTFDFNLIENLQKEAEKDVPIKTLKGKKRVGGKIKSPKKTSPSKAPARIARRKKQEEKEKEKAFSESELPENIFQSMLLISETMLKDKNMRWMETLRYILNMFGGSKSFPGLIIFKGEDPRAEHPPAYTTFVDIYIFFIHSFYTSYSEIADIKIMENKIDILEKGFIQDILFEFCYSLQEFLRKNFVLIENFLSAPNFIIRFITIVAFAIQYIAEYATVITLQMELDDENIVIKDIMRLLRNPVRAKRNPENITDEETTLWIKDIKNIIGESFDLDKYIEDLFGRVMRDAEIILLFYHIEDRFRVSFESSPDRPPVPKNAYAAYSIFSDEEKSEAFTDILVSYAWGKILLNNVSSSNYYNSHIMQYFGSDINITETTYQDLVEVSKSDMGAFATYAIRSLSEIDKRMFQDLTNVPDVIETGIFMFLLNEVRDSLYSNRKLTKSTYRAFTYKMDENNYILFRISLESPVLFLDLAVGEDPIITSMIINLCLYAFNEGFKHVINTSPKLMILTEKIRFTYYSLPPVEDKVQIKPTDLVQLYNERKIIIPPSEIILLLHLGETVIDYLDVEKVDIIEYLISSSNENTRKLFEKVTIDNINKIKKMNTGWSNTEYYENLASHILSYAFQSIDDRDDFKWRSFILDYFEMGLRGKNIFIFNNEDNYFTYDTPLKQLGERTSKFEFDLNIETKEKFEKEKSESISEESISEGSQIQEIPEEEIIASITKQGLIASKKYGEFSRKITYLYGEELSNKDFQFYKHIKFVYGYLQCLNIWDEGLKRFTSEFDSLIKDIRENPKDYEMSKEGGAGLGDNTFRDELNKKLEANTSNYPVIAFVLYVLFLMNFDTLLVKLKYSLEEMKFLSNILVNTFCIYVLESDVLYESEFNAKTLETYISEHIPFRTKQSKKYRQVVNFGNKVDFVHDIYIRFGSADRLRATMKTKSDTRNIFSEVFDKTKGKSIKYKENITIYFESDNSIILMALLNPKIDLNESGTVINLNEIPSGISLGIYGLSTGRYNKPVKGAKAPFPREINQGGSEVIFSYERSRINERTPNEIEDSVKDHLMEIESKRDLKRKVGQKEHETYIIESEFYDDVYTRVLGKATQAERYNDKIMDINVGEVEYKIIPDSGAWTSIIEDCRDFHKGRLKMVNKATPNVIFYFPEYEKATEVNEFGIIKQSIPIITSVKKIQPGERLSVYYAEDYFTEDEMELFAKSFEKEPENVFDYSFRMESIWTFSSPVNYHKYRYMMEPSNARIMFIFSVLQEMVRSIVHNPLNIIYIIIMAFTKSFLFHKVSPEYETVWFSDRRVERWLVGDKMDSLMLPFSMVGPLFNEMTKDNKYEEIDGSSRMLSRLIKKLTLEDLESYTKEDYYTLLFFLLMLPSEEMKTMNEKELKKCYIESKALYLIPQVISFHQKLYPYSLLEKFSSLIPLEFPYDMEYLVPQTDGSFKKQFVNKMFYEKGKDKDDPHLIISEITTRDQITRLTLDRAGYFRNRNGLIYSYLSKLSVEWPKTEDDTSMRDFAWKPILEYIYLKSGESKDITFKDMLEDVTYSRSENPKDKTTLISEYERIIKESKDTFSYYRGSEEHKEIMERSFKGDFNRFIQNEYYVQLENYYGSSNIPDEKELKMVDYQEVQYIEHYVHVDYKFPEKFMKVNEAVSVVKGYERSK